jgi:4-hydroxy-tetrahydrodipicolinate synthase
MTTFNLPDGIIPPLLTPLAPDQTVDTDALRQLIRMQLQAGTPGLFVAGSAGLGSILTAADYELLITTSLDETPEDYPVLCGVLESSTVRALERVRLLESLGAKAFVTITPYYVRATEHDDLLRHFGALRDASEMEMVAYNIPGCTGCELPVATVLEMARRGWVRSCKDSSGDDSYVEALCRQGAEFGLRVYQGMRPDFKWLSEIGASGCVPVPSNAYPELFNSGWNNRANLEQLATIQPEIDRVWEQLVDGWDYTSRSIRILAEKGIGSGTLTLPFSAS